jgi:hypothetical protein
MSGLPWVYKYGTLFLAARALVIVMYAVMFAGCTFTWLLASALVSYCLDATCSSK